MKNILLITFFILNFLSRLEAQNLPQTLDSLRQVLASFEQTKGYEKDTNYLNTLKSYGLQYQWYQPDSAVKWLKKALILDARYHLSSKRLALLKDLCMIYGNQNNPKLFDYAQQIIDLAEKKQDFQNLAEANFFLAFYYEKNQALGKALLYRLQELDYARQARGNEVGVVAVLANIASLYQAAGNYAKAEQYARAAIEAGRKIKRNDWKTLAQLAELYDVYNEILLNGTQKYEQALEYVLELKQRVQKNGHPELKYNAQKNICRIYARQGKFAEALACYQTTLQQFAQSDLDAKFKPQIYALMGDLYVQNRNLAQALQSYQQAKKAIPTGYDDLFGVTKGLAETAFKAQNYELALRESEVARQNYQKFGHKNALKEVYELQYKIYLAQQNYPQALASHQLFKNISDSLLINQNALKIDQVEAESNFKAEQTKILNAQKQKDLINTQRLGEQRLYLLGALLVLAIVSFAGLLIYRQNDRLKKTNQLKDRLFAIIAHDLRSPITSFQGISEQISYFLEKNKPERIHQLRELIAKSAQNLNHLLDNLLNWAVLQRNSWLLHKQKIDLKNLIDDNLKAFYTAAQVHQIILENLVPENCLVYTDPNALSTIIRNLLSNALKFTPEGGKINIQAKPLAHSSGYDLQVNDSGIGMSSEKAQSIFRLNAEKNSAGLRGEKGIGIGLSLCYEFAQLLSSNLQVKSQPGQGTTFSLRLPA
ncbi:MAG: ATP-binding protein [Microscillaceae bacterium]|jgi:signal transduction histidine kinase|nr:ATP-binding protein [Microscillaceae bacterium]